MVRRRPQVPRSGAGSLCSEWAGGWQGGCDQGPAAAVAAESSSAGAWSSGVAPKEAMRGDRGAQCRRCALHALIWSHGCVPLLPDRPEARRQGAGGCLGS